jgi:hypothetical protein
MRAEEGSMTTRTVWVASLALASSLAVACGSESRGGDDDGEANSDADTDADGDADADTGTEECAAVEESAQNGLSPVDIVFAVDTSGSMTEEAGFVQDNLNMFSAQIFNSGINAHIVLISAGSDQSNGICVAPPLGSGDCPADSNPDAGYDHVAFTVESKDAFLKIKQSYGQWVGMLRPNSIRHVVVVSDDNSMFQAQTFVDQMALLSPPFEGFTFHAIVSSMDPDAACALDPPHPCCTLAAEEGTIYEALVEATGGVLGDLCEQDFQPVFDQLAAEVADVPLACEWAIPDPPAGQIFDAGKVNVEFVDGDGEHHLIGHVGSFGDCADVTHGWYYDDNLDPATIYVCPQTCDWIRADLEASIAIQFGCTTQEAVE